MNNLKFPVANLKSFEAKWKRLLEATGAKTDSALAKELGILPQSVSAARRRRQIPGGWIEKISEHCNVDASWLLFGYAPGGEDSAEPVPAERAAGDTESPRAGIPVIGLAACGLAGWFNPGPLALRVTLPVDYPGGALFAVLAVGASMQPDGIRQGHVLFCDPSRTPEEDDAVFVGRKDGTASVKRFKGREGDWVRLQGWLDPDANGVQKPYWEQVAQDTVASIASVVIVKRKA